MNYFTDEKVINGTANRDYLKHSEQIWSKLLQGLKDIQYISLPQQLVQKSNNTVYIHDARIQAYEFSEGQQNLTLIVRSDNDGELRVSSFQYIGIVKTSPLPYQLIGTNSSECDILNQEIDMNDAGNYIHRLYFATNIEFEIIFQDFVLKTLSG
ncbi:MAG: hypothetical protein AAF485_00885 [Chloroflexota bacterium]